MGATHNNPEVRSLRQSPRIQSSLPQMSISGLSQCIFNMLIYFLESHDKSPHLWQVYRAWCLDTQVVASTSGLMGQQICPCRLRQV
jgi:hypothetical protein